MRIRRFQDGDARDVSNLIKKCLREVNSKDYPEEVIRFMCGHFTPKRLIQNSKERTVLVADEGGTVLGTASLKDNVVLTVFVDPKKHGIGVGSRLMGKIEDLARSKGHKSVKLPSSLTSHGFYVRRGYKKVKMLHSDEFGDTVLMRKML